jgi:1-aminocyclopropane-1-carboxylate deaminase/D-cysteine desulfhydrase-like pyridoxal-dependent ACC family enzyme
MLFALRQLWLSGQIARKAVVAVHTGGLQGLRGYGKTP